MENQKIEKKLIDILSEITKIDKNLLEDNTLLIYELGVDSLILVELLISIEFNFNINLIANEVTIKQDISIKELRDIICEQLK